MKREEHNEVRRVREANAKRIEELKLQSLNANRSKHDTVKVSEKESKSNIDRYWTNHLVGITKVHNDRKNSHVVAKNQSDLYLQRLEKQELELI